MTRAQAIAFRRKIELASAWTDDADALEIVELFPMWVPNKHVIVGERLQHKGVLYKCIQEHTTLSGWEPDLTPALWVRVSVEEWPEWVQPQGRLMPTIWVISVPTSTGIGFQPLTTTYGSRAFMVGMKFDSEMKKWRANQKNQTEKVTWFIMPQRSQDCFVFPICFRFVRDGRAKFTGGSIESCDFLSIEIFCFRLVIGVIKS